MSVTSLVGNNFSLVSPRGWVVSGSSSDSDSNANPLVVVTEAATGKHVPVEQVGTDVWRFVTTAGQSYRIARASGQRAGPAATP